LRLNWHEQKPIFVTIKQNDIDWYIIRNGRSVVSLHPIVHRCMIMNRNFVDTTCLYKVIKIVTIRNNMDIVRRNTTFIIATPRAATCFSYTKQPSSGRMYQEILKENYTSVAVWIIIKSMAKISPLHKVHAKAMSGKHFYNT